MSTLSGRRWHGTVSPGDMSVVFKICKANNWVRVLQIVQSNPSVAISPMVMPNNIPTTILHQVISSKSDDLPGRRNLVLGILEVAGHDAVMIKNGYGSLPLHVILQRNTKMDSATKEQLAFALIHANTDALLVAGGPGKRTPLHIAFTDYISPQLVQFMIQHGARATAMKDSKGYLPIHVACSRHCSPEKLQMLLDANPLSLLELTNKGESLLDLATTCATKSHPNYALIDKIKQELEKVEVPTNTTLAAAITPRVEAKLVKSASFTSHLKQQLPRSLRRRQVQPTSDVDSNAVDLLMHFHHSAVQETSTPRNFAEV